MSNQMWRCEGCGEWLDAPDHGNEESGYGHTVPEHAPNCSPEYGCSLDCPIPVACGPVTLASTDREEES